MQTIDRKKLSFNYFSTRPRNIFPVGDIKVLQDIGSRNGNHGRRDLIGGCFEHGGIFS